ncbi:MAG TPA: hydrogenase formation protein HypD [Clostridiaceae bacterium]
MEITLKDKISYINSFKDEVSLMEVCGTHTVAISKFGIRNILSKNINLISGPGCPVCVTPNIYLDYIYDLSLKENVIIVTYGDMIRVPGSKPSITLEKAKAKGAKVRIVYSSIDALEIAKKNNDKKVVFLGIGFETTTPASAVLIKEAARQNIKNIYILSLHKLVEPVMRAILEDKTMHIDGFLCPGHVALVTGEKGFDFLEEYDCTGVIAGFELEEIVEALYQLLINIKSENNILSNCYKKLIKREGNKYSQELIKEVFDIKDDYWRGLGLVPNSGYRIKSIYKAYDIEELFPINFKEANKANGCECGEVLKGKIKPNECKLFKVSCNPENPIGPCMVSSEGSCATYYKYSI